MDEYKDFILQLTNKAKGQPLTEIEAGILGSEGRVNKLKAENKELRKKIEELEEWQETAHHAGIDRAEME